MKFRFSLAGFEGFSCLPKSELKKLLTTKQRRKKLKGAFTKMTTRIYDECGQNKSEMRCIKNIERSKLLKLLERERRLTNFLTEHHAELILQNPGRPIEQIETVIAFIGKHPEIRETDQRINNILDAYDDFKTFSEQIRERTKAAAFDRLESVRRFVRASV